ncbi:hypothetical protein J6590_035879 [Homalodisca vitripennis]|nr:hypothetical protein J6590_035879 [Homalodisca vitripennis]
MSTSVYGALPDISEGPAPSSAETENMEVQRAVHTIIVPDHDYMDNSYLKSNENKRKRHMDDSSPIED